MIDWWRKVGDSRRGHLGMCAATGNFQAQVLSAAHLGVMLRSCPVRRTCCENITKVPLFQAFVDHLCFFPLHVF
jgi:hypothetical protein